MYVRPQRLSAKGAQFIGRFEGLRLTPYNDVAGNATIGYGHLIHLGRVTQADRTRYAGFTAAYAVRLLQADAAGASESVRTHVRAKINQAQHDALVSFAFNVGTGAFEDSQLLQVLNRYPGTDSGIVGSVALAQVREQLLRWDRAGGVVVDGLHRRRLAEARLFATGIYQ